MILWFDMLGLEFETVGEELAGGGVKCIISLESLVFPTNDPSSTPPEYC